MLQSRQSLRLATDETNESPRQCERPIILDRAVCGTGVADDGDDRACASQTEYCAAVRRVDRQVTTLFDGQPLVLLPETSDERSPLERWEMV